MGHTNFVQTLLLISNELMASGSGDNTIIIWNITNWSIKGKIQVGFVIGSLGLISDCFLGAGSGITNNLYTKFYNLHTGLLVKSIALNNSRCWGIQSLQDNTFLYGNGIYIQRQACN